MPNIENILRDLKERTQNKKLEPYPVSPGTYNFLMGATHGALTAIFCGVLNPIERINAQLAIRSSFNLPELPVKSAEKPAYSFRSTYQFIKQTLFAREMWRGTFFTVKTNISRNALIYPLWPILKDKMKNEGYSPIQGTIIAGVGLGVMDSTLTAKTRLIKTIINTTHEEIRPAQIKKNLGTKGQIKGVFTAWIWSNFRSSGYWIIYPIIAKSCESTIQLGMHSLNLKDTKLAAIMNYSVAGALAGAFIPAICYPLALCETRSLANHYRHITQGEARTNQLKEIRDTYRQHGLLHTIRHKTHTGMITTSIPRAIGVGTFFNLAMHASEAICPRILKKEEHPPSISKKV